MDSINKLRDYIAPKVYAFGGKSRIGQAAIAMLLYVILPKIRQITGRKDTRDLLKFRNIHKGKRIFVIATGPSLREEDVLKLKDEITISVNGSVALAETIGWRPTYYCISDIEVYWRERDRIINAGLKDVFMYLWIMKRYESEFTFTPHYFDGYQRLKDVISILRGKEYEDMEFSNDIYLKGAYLGGRSIMAVAVQLAAYMGASEIYLLGQDCDYRGPKQYFNNTVNNHVVQNPEDINKAVRALFTFYRAARKYCESHNIKLCNATRGGRLEELERVNFDDLVD